MKLHLPSRLRSALLACMGLLAPLSTTLSMADEVAYSGTIYTWKNTETSTADLANGAWAESTLKADGTYTYGSDITDGSDISPLIGVNNTNDRNTLRFDRSVGSNGNMIFSFDPLAIAGFIVESGTIVESESGTTGYSIVSGGTASSQSSIYIGNNNGTEAFSTIHESFSISNEASTNTNTGIFLRGTQTITIDTDKTLTLTAGSHTISVSGDLTVSGGGTLALSGNFTNSATLNIEASSAVSISGSINTKTINNSGSITVSDGTSVVLDSLLPSSQFGDGERTTGLKTATGAFTLSKGEGTVILGNNLTYTYKGIDATVVWDSGNKAGTATVSGLSYYYIAGTDTVAYSFANAKTPTWITVSEKATLSELPETISTAIKGSGTISMNALGGQVEIAADKLTEFTGSLVINSGRFNEVNNGHVFSNVTVNNGGQFFIRDNYNYSGNINITGTGWNASNDLAKAGALRLGQNSELSGDLVLLGDASVISYNSNSVISGKVSGDYELTINAPSGSLTISGVIKGESRLTKKGAGTLRLLNTSLQYSGNIAVSAGTLFIGRTNDGVPYTLSLSDLTVEKGAVLKLQYCTGTIASVALNGGEILFFDSNKATDSISIGSLAITQSSTLETVWKGVLNVGVLTGGEDLVVTHSPTVETSADIIKLNIGKLSDYSGTLSKGGTKADTLLISMSSANQAKDKSAVISSDVTLSSGFYLEGGGSLSFTGAVTAAGSITNSGAGSLSFGNSVTIAGSVSNTGGGSLSFSGDTLTLGGAIFNTGALTFGDSTAITVTSGVSVQDFCGYTDKGEASANGYIDTTKAWIVRNLGDGASITGGAGISTVSIGRTEYSIIKKDSEGWYIEATLTDDPGAYYVNSGVVVYQGDTRDEQGGIADATTLKLNGGTLKMTASLTDQVKEGIRVLKSSVVDLSGENVVLKKSELEFGSGASLLLRGNGIYDIGDKTNTGVTLVSGENGWTGTIAVSGTALGGPIEWNNYVNGTFSTLQLTSVKGWIGPNTTVAANLRLLEGSDGAAGFTITGVNDDAFYSFTGKISGDGDLEMSQTATRTATYNLQGDCSKWTGNFLLSNLGSGTATVNYAGSSVIGNGFVNASAATMNVFINKDDEAVTLQGAITKKGSGALNITLSGSSVKTLQKAVTASSLTVNDGAATLEDTLTVDTLTANTDTSLKGTDNVIGTLAGTGKLLVSGGTTEVTNALADGTAVEVTGGTLTLEGGTAAGSGVVTVKDGGTLSLKGGADAAVETSFASGTVTLEKGGVLTCSGKTTLTGTVTGSGSLLVNQDSSLTVKGSVTLGNTIVNNGSLSVGDQGSISFDSVLGLESIDLAFKDPIDTGSVNGYASGAFTVVKVTDPNDNTSTSLTKVILEETEYGVSVKDDNSAYIVTKQPDGGLYYICSGTVSYGADTNSAASADTTGLVLMGGNLLMLTDLKEKAADQGGIVLQKNPTDAMGTPTFTTISVADGETLDHVSLDVTSDIKLKILGYNETDGEHVGEDIILKQLTGNGTLVSGSGIIVKESGSFTGTYDGVVRLGTVSKDAVQKLRADANLTVIGTAGTVEVTGLTSANPDTPNVLGGIATTGASVRLDNKTDAGAPTKVTLVSASSMNGGETGCDLEFTVSAAQVNANLAAAKADKPTVTTGAKLDLTNVTLKVNEVDNTGFAYNTDGPEKDILLFVVSDNTESTVNNVTIDMSGCSWMSKYFTNFRVVEGSVNVIADANTSIYVSHGQTPNGTAGLALAGKAMFRLNPQTLTPNSELAQVLNMLDNHIATGNTGAMDKLGAALAGSSLSAVGLALADDVQRQLRSIRNRTTTMGVNECVVNEDMPYVNGWISGDGNYRQLSESGTDAGYQLSSWGGTVGVDVDVNPNLTLGVAVSALFGDYTGKAADTLTGDLDTQYVSLFARVSTGSWVNTFVGTLGRADVDLARTLPGIAGKTTYKTNGMMFGFLYEVARTFALNEDASTCVQPLFNMSFSHTSLDSATESGTADTRLTTDSASLTQFSLGLGGRLQSIVGENEYNRASIFEARALLKLDLGDRYSKLNTALAALPTATVTTRSNEKGVIGAEVGASLTIPISQDAGSVFFDVNADFNADQTGVNGSVGYRVNF